MTRTRPLLAALAASALALSPVFVTVPATAAATGVQVYWSSESRTAGYEPKNGNWYTNPATGLAGTPYQLSRQADVPVVAAAGTPTITVDTNTRFQSILGVGSSLEESTVFNLSRMSATARDRALRALVDPATGAGFNVIRITFGTSDFTSHDFYTYDDGAADPTLSRFSIQRDIDYGIIATLRQALAINPDIKVFASAWSAPPWMKTSNNIIGGSLNTSQIPTLATYYRRAVQAYTAQGIPIHALTLQNEPLFSPPTTQACSSPPTRNGSWPRRCAPSSPATGSTPASGPSTTTSPSPLHMRQVYWEAPAPTPTHTPRWTVSPSTTTPGTRPR